MLDILLEDIVRRQGNAKKIVESGMENNKNKQYC